MCGPSLLAGRAKQVVQAPAPARPIDQGLPGPGLLAHVLVSKFADHLPLYRQSEIYAREGVDLCRSTLAGWVGAASELLAPLVDQIRRHVMAGSKYTPMIRRFRCWLPARARPRRPGCGPMYGTIDLLAIRPHRQCGSLLQDRKGEHPRQHLLDFRGALQADAYSGFHHLYGAGAIYEVACSAHARRKFYDVHLAHASPTTTEAMLRIGALYGIEEEIRGMPAERRCSVRGARPATAGQSQAVDGEGAALPVHQERDGSCHPLRAIPLARSDPLRR